MITVLDPGFYTTIQDMGRDGFRQYGVPVSGVMDRYSGKLANMLLGNNSSAAVLEMTMTGVKLKFKQPAHVAIAGADLQPSVNGISVDSRKIISLKKDEVLSFGKMQNGFRTYLAIEGGFKSDVVLGSQSMYQAITKSFKLQKNDSLMFRSVQSEFNDTKANVKYDTSILNSTELEVTEGPEFQHLSKKLQKQLFNSELTVSKNNSRMAYQLEELFQNNLKPILTSPVLPGTVQLTPSGGLIILMRDCQTTGGYPRVLQLTEKAMNIISQKTTGNHIKFRRNGW
ncbi:5-oxoprolinase subunit C family protein [Winogradskyella ursingii]|uniref:5-oxoprolinase subunit C family protein n=1 Tax=Winogradskyella ursingii TaxID=2686079 RepID=UPI0015CEBCBB|nr:biotin-dependent carboxyltransferase family protein [Winogradskyella ursingii]